MISQPLFAELRQRVDHVLALHRQDERITMPRALVMELRAASAAADALAPSRPIRADRE